MRRITIKRALTWRYRRMRPHIEQSNVLAPLSAFRSSLDCTINTSGCDFRKGQVAVKALNPVAWGRRWAALLTLALRMRARLLRGGRPHHIHAREKSGPAAKDRGDCERAKNQPQIRTRRRLHPDGTIDIGKERAQQSRDRSAAKEHHGVGDLWIHCRLSCLGRDHEKHERRSPVEKHKKRQRPASKAIALPLYEGALELRVARLGPVGRKSSHRQPRQRILANSTGEAQGILPPFLTWQASLSESPVEDRV